jgi:imidazolonepropionase-like amidohydrolase
MREDPAGATTTSRPVIYYGAAMTDARGDRLRLGVDVVVERGIVVSIEDSKEEFSPWGSAGERVVDARGATIVPGLVDCHSHLTMPGGADWAARATDPDEIQLAAAEYNAQLLWRSGVRWARDVGAARARDTEGGQARALSLIARDRWRGKRDYPYVRAAGTWLSHASYEMLREISIQVADGDGLAAAAGQQLDEGADFVKLYMDGPDADTSPFTAGEVAKVVALAHARAAKVTAHTTQLAGARAAVAGGCDALEHGWHLDADVVAEMAAAGTYLVPTLAVLESMRTFATTTSIPRFASEAGMATVAERRERAHSSVRLAHSHGVVLAAGTDSGGGSVRANQLSWEIETMAELGVPLWEALAGATWRAGDLLGEPEAGRIRVGGPADFFLIHGDPLSDARALSRVWRVA